MRRKHKVLEYIAAKKYYLSLIGCLIITLVAVSIIYNRDQKYEEIANLNDPGKAQSLVENPDEEGPITEEAVLGQDGIVPYVSAHEENIPEISIQDVPEVTEATIDTELTTEVVATDLTTEEVAEGTATDVEQTSEATETFNPTIKVQQPDLAFDVATGMTKPLSGEVVIGYSNNLPVYFKTLDQYKVSQGLYLSGEVGTEVKAAADGVIETIANGSSMGTTVTIYHGDGYKTMYAQLSKDLNVKEGDLVYKGQIIGYVAMPTSYFALEGPHLYFEVLANGKPVDPTPLFQ